MIFSRKWGGFSTRRFSGGVTLLEALISLVIGLIVTGAMVALMGNSMGSATRIIEMSQLTDEMRNVMHLLTRDLRRANYTATALYCYGNSDCGTDGSAPQSGDININADNDCITFNLDRDWDGDATEDGAGGFRRRVVDSVGVIEMWIGNASPGCDVASNDWVAVTDPGFVDITTFTITDDKAFVGTINEEGGSSFNQRIRQVTLTVGGRLLIDNDINRTLVDEIRVRNDYIY